MEMSPWMTKNKDVSNPELTDSRQNVDINTLNDMQKHVHYQEQTCEMCMKGM